MRRTLAIVAALLIMAAFSACGGGHGLTPAAQNSAPASAGLDLTGWTMPELPGTVPPAPDNPDEVWKQQRAAAPKAVSAVYDMGLAAGFGPHTLTAYGQPPTPPGPGSYYQYLTSNPATTIDAQNYSEVHVHGRVVSHSLRDMIYAELGLVTWETWDYSINQQHVPSYMFNQNVFMIAALDNGGIPFAAAMDKNGSTFMGPAVAIPPSFDFDLWLSPNVGGTGGMMRLSINGGAYSAPFAYGKDNWGWRPAENFSSSMLLANIYSANSEGDTGTFTIEDLRVTEGPLPTDNRGEWYTRGRTQLRRSESPRLGPQTGSIQWTTPPNGFNLFGGPAYASDGTIYYTAGNFLYAYRPDGTQRWAYNAGEFCGRGGVTVGPDGTIYFGASSGSSTPRLHAVKPDGTVLWTFTCVGTGSIWCTPAVANGRIYFGTGNGDNTIYTLNATNGTLVNALSLGIGGHIGISAPAVADAGGTVYINGGTQLLALNPSGTLKWAYTFPGTAYDSPPCIAPDGVLYIGCNDGNLYCIQDNGATGSLHLAFGGTGFVAGGNGGSSPVIDDLGGGNYNVYTSDSTLRAFSRTGIPLWMALTLPTGLASAPAIGSDGMLYVTTPLAPHVTALRRSDGAAVWTLSLGAQTYGSPAIAANGNLYATDMNGSLYCITGAGTNIEIDSTTLSNAFMIVRSASGTALTGNLTTNAIYNASAILAVGSQFYVTYGVDNASQPSDLVLYPSRPAGGVVTVNAASLTIDPSLQPYFDNPAGTRRLRLKAGAYNRLRNNMTSLSDALYILHETNAVGATTGTIGGPYDTDLSATQTAVLRLGINYRPQFAAEAYPVAGSNATYGGKMETIYPQEHTTGWFTVGAGTIAEAGSLLGNYFTQAGLLNTMDSDAFCRFECDAQHPFPGFSTPFGFQDNSGTWIVPMVPGLLPTARPYDTLAIERDTVFHAAAIAWSSPNITVGPGRLLNGSTALILTNFLGENMTLRVLPVRIWDNPAAADPGAAGTVAVTATGWNVTLNFLMQYGAPNYTVQLDADYGGSWNDGIAGRVYTVSGSPYGAMPLPADHLKSSVTSIASASQPAGIYTFALRVTDSLGAVYTYVWPAPLTLPGWGNAVPSPATTGMVGQHTSMKIVNGNPAISFYDWGNGDLMYVRATNIYGSAWGTPVTVDSAGDVGWFTSLCVVNGNPAISYYDVDNGDLKYVRANDTSGTSWGAPQTLHSTNSIGWDTSLAVVNGNPAISYYYSTGNDLYYIRASNANGTAWNAPVLIDGNGGQYTSLNGDVNGRPAISYYNGDLRFVRASNADGTAWPAPQNLDQSGDVGYHTSLVVVNNRPAVSYYLQDDGTGNQGDLRYIRAQNPTGANWNAFQTLDNGGDVGQYSSMAIVGGNPAVAYFDLTNDNLKYIGANDQDGDTWATPATLDSTGSVGDWCSLAVVAGQPAVSYFDFTNGDLKYIRYYP